MASPDPDRLELRQPFTVLRVFFGCMLTPIGLSMLIGAAWTLLAPGNDIPARAPGFFHAVDFGMDVSGAVMMALVGLLFTAIGSVLFLSRRVVSMDRKAMEATTRWLVWTPFGRICAKRSTFKLGSARAVLSLREERRGSEGEKSWLFALAVERKEGTNIPLLQCASDQPCSFVASHGRRALQFIARGRAARRPAGARRRLGRPAA